MFGNNAERELSYFCPTWQFRLVFSDQVRFNIHENILFVIKFVEHEKF